MFGAWLLVFLKLCNTCRSIAIWYLIVQLLAESSIILHHLSFSLVTFALWHFPLSIFSVFIDQYVEQELLLLASHLCFFCFSFPLQISLLCTHDLPLGFPALHRP